jgi:hypothetical protein
MTFSFERPARREDVPAPLTKAVRRAYFPDGRWVDVCGGGSQIESRFYGWLQDENRKRHADALKLEDPAARQRAEDAAAIDYNAYMATFIADRVIDHSLVYPGAGGEKLPLGLDLFWHMEAVDVWTLMAIIQQPSQHLADPKAESPSDGG